MFRLCMLRDCDVPTFRSNDVLEALNVDVHMSLAF